MASERSIHVRWVRTVVHYLYSHSPGLPLPVRYQVCPRWVWLMIIFADESITYHRLSSAPGVTLDTVRSISSELALFCIFAGRCNLCRQVLEEHLYQSKKSSISSIISLIQYRKPRFFFDLLDLYSVLFLYFDDDLWDFSLLRYLSLRLAYLSSDLPDRSASNFRSLRSLFSRFRVSLLSWSICGSRTGNSLRWSSVRCNGCLLYTSPSPRD